MRHISVHSFKEVVGAEQGNPSVDFVNVCTPAEYKEKHIPGVRNVPLDTLAEHYNEFATKETIYIHCRSGRRGQQAIETLESLGVQAALVNVEGGIEAWDQAGLPVTRAGAKIPLMRQVLIAAGALVVLGYLTSLFIHPAFIYLSVFVGAGLLFAGITGWCGMAFMLARMPWNK